MFFYDSVRPKSVTHHNFNLNMDDLLLDVENDEIVIEKKVLLKYCPRMEILLVKVILAANAHKSSSKGTNQVKFCRVVDTLWQNPLFSSKGPKRDWSTVRNKFLGLLNAFKKKVGLGTSDMINTSALPDIDKLSEVDALLFQICRDEEVALEEITLIKEAAEEKAAIKDGVTNVVTSGAGRKGLPGMAQSLLASKPNSAKYKKFAMGFGSPNETSSSSSSSSSSAPEKTKKRKADADNVDGSQMQKLLLSFTEEAIKEEKKEKKIMDFMESSSKAIQSLAESTAASNLKLSETMDMLGNSIIQLAKRRN